MMCLFFFKQKTAYEMRISDWSSDVCSSDLEQAMSERKELTDEYLLMRYCALCMSRDEDADAIRYARDIIAADRALQDERDALDAEIGRASCRERACQYV